METRRLRKMIIERRERAIDKLIQETEKGHSSVYWTLKGEIDAYTDVIEILRGIGDEMAN